MAGLLTHGWSRVAVLAGTVCALLAALLVAPAAAEHYEDVREVSAGDGVAAAAAYSKLAFPTGAANALLGRADVFADSLASGVMQNDRPLLLTNNYNLSAPTKDELARLKVGTVTILGGLSAVSSGVEQELKDLGYRVNRLNGPTRIETAIEVAQASSPGRTALLARGFGSADPTSAFADSLAAGGWAAEKDLPILLTETDKLSQPTADFLRGRIDQLFVVGGRAAVSDAVITQARALGVAVTRISGTNRFETAVAIAKARGFANAANAAEVVLVDGQGANAWTDGFAVAAYAGRNKAPVVLANSAATSLPAATSTFLNAGPQADLLAGWTVPAAQVTQAAEGMDKDAVTTRVMQVALHGDNVVRKDSAGEPHIWGHGVRGKTGLLTMTIDEETNSIDYTFESQLTGPYAPVTPDSSGLVIRKAPLDARGAAVVRFPEPKSTGQSSGTVTRSVFATGFHVRELIQNPSAFYAEASTDNDYRTGAIRGQLPSGGTSHLPGKPTFSGITTSAGDRWITLKFAAPVFNPLIAEVDKLVSSDFTITVDGVQVALQTAEPTTAPKTAAGAKDTFIIKIDEGAANPAPTANKETVVTLKASGAQKLQNNLGDRVSTTNVTLRQVTPADMIDPTFTGIEAGANSDLLKTVFSEPIYVSSALANSTDIKVEWTGSTGAVTATHQDAPTSASQRTRTLQFRLSQTMPANAEIRVTITSLGAAKVTDAAGRKMAGPVTRSALAVALPGFLNPTVTPLVVAGSSSAATGGQSQTVAVTLQEALPAGGQLAVQVPSTVATNNQYTYGEVDPITTGLPVGTATTYDSNTATYTFTLPGATSLPAGSRPTFTFREITVRTTLTSELANAGKVKITRRDTGVVTEAPFGRLRGVHITGVTYPGGGKQDIAFQLRQALAKNVGGVLRFDLSHMKSLGVVYPSGSGADASLSISATPALAGMSAKFINSPVDGVEISSTEVINANHAITLTISNVTFPAATEWTLGSRVTATRVDGAGEPSAGYTYRAGTAKADNIQNWGRQSTHAMAFRLPRLVEAGEQVEFRLTRDNLGYPATGSTQVGPAGTVTATKETGTTNKWILAFAPTAAMPADTLVQMSFAGITSQLVDSTPIAVTPLHSRSGVRQASLPSIVVATSTAKIVVGVTYEDAGQTNVDPADDVFGDDANDTLYLTFDEAIDSVNNTAYKVTIDDGTAQGKELTCGSSGIVCSGGTPQTAPADKTLTVRVTAPFVDGAGAVTGITGICDRMLKSLAGAPAGTGAAPNSHEIARAASMTTTPGTCS